MWCFIMVFDCREYALKIIFDGDIHSFNHEKKIMETLQGHSNIIRLEDDFRQTTVLNRTVSVFVYELAHGGELFYHLNDSGYFPENLARTYFRQLILAIKHCHDRNVIHFDIKYVNWKLKLT